LQQTPDEYLQEAQRLYQAQHPKVVPINYAAIQGDILRVVMPYFAHGSIQTRFAGAPIAVREAVKIANDFLGGLYHVHTVGLVHLDIKPSNLLVHGSGNIMLSDFGQSRHTNVLGTAETPRMYGRHFPPEGFIFNRLTQQADIYQAGVTLFRLLNGEYVWNETLKKVPGRGGFRAALENGTFVKASDFLPHIPSQLKRIVKKAMHPDPASRFQTAFELRNALSKVDRGLAWSVATIEPKYYVWHKNSGTHVQVVKMWQNTDNQWQSESYSLRLRDQARRNHLAWSASSNKEGVLRHLRERFGEP
jgi:serine/threonine protein kinase